MDIMALVNIVQAGKNLEENTAQFMLRKRILAMATYRFQTPQVHKLEDEMGAVLLLLPNVPFALDDIRVRQIAKRLP